MKIEIKANNEKAVEVLKKYSKMKQRGVKNIWKENDQVLFMKFPPLTNIERLRPMYINFIDEQLENEGLTKKDYEVTIK